MRFNYQSYMKDGNGNVVAGAIMSVYLAGTTTPANVYEASSGGVVVNSVTSGADGKFEFWVDDGDYTGEQAFKTVSSATNFRARTTDYINIVPWMWGGSGTTANRPTVTTVGMCYIDTDIPATVYWNGSAWASNAVVTDLTPKLASSLDADSNDINNLNDIVTSRNITFTGTLNTISTTVFGYLSGVTSNIQTQINSLLTRNSNSIGEIVMCPIETPFAGTLECDGSAKSRATYADLFAVIGSLYGVGDGSTTFNLPDIRGIFPRGWDHGAGVDPDAATRTDAGDGSTTGDHVGTRQDDAFESHAHEILLSPHATNDGPRIEGSGAANNTTGNTAVEGGNETRPINVNVMYCIRFQ